MKDVTIIENVVPEVYRKEIESTLLNPNFPWNFSPEISFDTARGNPFKQNPGIVQSCGFTHALCVEDQFSTFGTMMNPIIYFMAEKSGYSKFEKGVSVIRAKANLQTQLTSGQADNHNMPHIDPAWFEKGGGNWIFLYYVNDSDGDTFIFNETAKQSFVPEKLTLRQRVTPKANTGILFRDNIYHASSNPIDNPYRINLNFNLIAG